VTGVPLVTGVRDRIPAQTGPPVPAVRDRIPAQTGPPVPAVRDRIPPLIGRPAGAARMARPRGLPAVGLGTARRDVTSAVTAPRHRPAGVTETAGLSARPLGGKAPEREREAVLEAR